MHYALAFQGIFDQLWKMYCEKGLSIDLLLQYAQMPAQERHQAVANRAHAVRSIALIRDVYGTDAESDFRIGAVKVIAAIEGARTGELLFRDFADEMRSVK